MWPPVAPIGLEYVASAIERRGYEPVVCDLTFADDWRTALSEAMNNHQPMAVGVTVRNIDDAYFASQDFVLKTTRDVVRHVRDSLSAPVVLGGIGFSCAPRSVLAFTGATYGIVGEGENAFPDLLDRLALGHPVDDVPGAVFYDGDAIVVNAPKPVSLADMPGPKRRYVDNIRYFIEGGQAGIETKRGCLGQCVYCVDPLAKGRCVRGRSPDSIADEIRDLYDQGIDVLHMCDSEFNTDVAHAHRVCDAMVRSGLADVVKWYTYASPNPFNYELARAMVLAGCVGVNFGVDHGDSYMLARLGRTYTPNDIRYAAQVCRKAGLTIMFDMLLGSPGETRESIVRAIDLMQEIKPDRVGLSCGVRVYPNTGLAEFVERQGPMSMNPNLHGVLKNNDDFLQPVFYVESCVGEGIHGYVASLIKGDDRFLHTDPSLVDGNYNYNNNSTLAQAIANGARGAYWDILRKVTAA